MVMMHLVVIFAQLNYLNRVFQGKWPHGDNTVKTRINIYGATIGMSCGCKR